MRVFLVGHTWNFCSHSLIIFISNTLLLYRIKPSERCDPRRRRMGYLRRLHCLGSLHGFESTKTSETKMDSYTLGCVGQVPRMLPTLLGCWDTSQTWTPFKTLSLVLKRALTPLKTLFDLERCPCFLVFKRGKTRV
jgi:hypothetical protein